MLAWLYTAVQKFGVGKVFFKEVSNACFYYKNTQIMLNTTTA